MGADWIRDELAGVDFGDKRLAKRSQKILESFYNQPMASVPQACGSAAAAKAAYNFFDNFSVSADEVLKSHGEQTLRRMASSPVILAVNDTTSLNHGKHTSIQGMGKINGEGDAARGFHLHSTLAITPEGVCLGVLRAKCWTRSENSVRVAQQRYQRPVEEKESFKWIDSFQTCRQMQERLPGILIVQIGDRESDLYDLFQSVQAGQGPQLLVRAEQNRNLLAPEEEPLWEHLAAQPAAGTFVVEVAKRAKHPARQAMVTVRFAPVTLKPPRHRKASERLPPVRLWAVWAEETEPPAGVEPIQWMLLTTLPVTEFSQAMEKIQWYTRRWEIEVFHKIIKSGCRVEERRFEEYARHERCLAFDLIVAWRILFLTKLNRETPDLPAAVVFSQDELDALYAVTHQKPISAPQNFPLRETIRMVACLGGFLGRKGDGNPGIVTIWRGLQRLKDITFGWCVARNGLPPP